MILETTAAWVALMCEWLCLTACCLLAQQPYQWEQEEVLQPPLHLPRESTFLPPFCSWSFGLRGILHSPSLQEGSSYLVSVHAWPSQCIPAVREHVLTQKQSPKMPLLKWAPTTLSLHWIPANSQALLAQYLATLFTPSLLLPLLPGISDSLALGELAVGGCL